MSIAEKLRSNAEVHGIAWAAAWAAKRGINIDTVLWVLCRKYHARFEV